jgi:hypothetical protein
MTVPGAVGAGRQFGAGPLARAAAAAYTLLVVEVLLALTAAPGLAVLVLLDRDASNIVVFAACAVPIGPALSAAVYALHRRRLDLTDLHPAAAFWRGYRLNAGPVLRIWIPMLAALAVIAVNLAYRSAAGVPVWWSVLLGGVAAVLAVAAANALVIASLFVFRTVDVARLAVYFLVRRPGVALGNAGLALLAGAVTVLTSEAVAMLLASVLAGGLLAVGRPMITDVERNFVA